MGVNADTLIVEKKDILKQSVSLFGRKQIRWRRKKAEKQSEVEPSQSNNQTKRKEWSQIKRGIKQTSLVKTQSEEREKKMQEDRPSLTKSKLKRI